MKIQIKQLFQDALSALQADGTVPAEIHIEIQVERARDAKFGDFACNLAMLLAKPARRKPRELAEALLANLPISDWVEKAEIAGPGFINIFLTPHAWHAEINAILTHDGYGHGVAQSQKVLLEFVSANPTGPLHVGHGRGAAYGGTLANLLRAAGYDVHCEYYVNDAGRQMDILAVSVWLRYLDLAGERIEFPTNGYQGDYIWDIAATLHREHGDAFRQSAASVFADLPADEPAGGDKEKHIDGLIARAQSLLGEPAYRLVHALGVNTILDDIRRDLSEFGVEYDEWFSERGLTEHGLVTHALNTLTARGHTYEQDGALWFRATDFGDEKDRVLVRENGQTTYFASDVAYHLNKLERGFHTLIDIWGADHHGYIPRVKASMQAMGANAESLAVLLVQFVTLFRGDERLQMSTRSGEFITLRELRHEVGNDAARFFYVLRRTEQHLEFDLELAKSQSQDNPVYYIQYAHARICSVSRELENKGWQWTHHAPALVRLDNEHEQVLFSLLARYPEVIENAAAAYEPHQLAYYLRDLATAFHTYYNAHKLLVEDTELRTARLSLAFAVQKILRDCLAILGVSAPETM